MHCMNDDIVLPVNKGFLSHKFGIHSLSVLYLYIMPYRLSANTNEILKAAAS